MCALLLTFRHEPRAWMPLRRASVQRHLAPTDEVFYSVRLRRNADVFVLSEGMRGFVCPLAPVSSVSPTRRLGPTKTTFGVTLT